MARQIFVNLAVKDLLRSRAFFSALGFGFEPRFTDENAACLVIDENIYAMLLVEDFFKTFTDKALCDARTCNEVLVCFSCHSRAEVNELVKKARIAGGSIPREAKDHGFMYEHAFEDLDGHIWELVYMVPDTAATD